jgi:hypothetical protein
MKLTELILELHTIMLKEGNLDVFTIRGCGCCDGNSDPEVFLSGPSDEDHYRTGYGPAGVYVG